MLDKLDRFWQTPKLGLALAVISVTTFNNWLLGIFLNPVLFDHDGSVSDFSALTQPHHWVFRTLDITSGVFFVLLAIWMAKRLGFGTRAKKFLIWTTAVLGVANTLDASLPLKCSETLDPGCYIPVTISLTHYQMPGHAYSSVIIAICYLILPVAGLVYAASRKLNVFMLFSALATTVALESLMSALIQYFDQGSLSVRTSGDGQEIQMLILAAWFISWGWAVYRRPHPGAKPSKLKTKTSEV